MQLEPKRFQELLNDFRFDLLFNELGWDRASAQPHSVQIGDEHFSLTPIAQKRGVTIFQCSPDRAGAVPQRPLLLKIEKEAGKLAHEHLLIFTDQAHTVQTWLWVSRVPGQPAATRTHTWYKGTSGESLRQKLEHIAFTLSEEESITLTLASQRLRDAFDRDRVTKSFYTRFAEEHGQFTDFIAGITVQASKQWYASLMLNRLMFVYFIQKKGFLDGNVNYLGERLRQVQAKAGKGKFHSFYRQFLRRLFHEGLGLSKPRGVELDTLLGDIPYLNGGLFDVHELEEAHPDIDIPDEAFERLFRFFDAYDWHLDDRPLASGSEINPDVLGYIFEKYINQKQMGAYYTKEDITGYIAKNTIVPFLLERARERCKVAFDGDASIWSLLATDPDRYLYPAMRRGVVDKAGKLIAESALPDFVQTGMNDAKARMFDKRYNLGAAQFATPDGESGTLPSETWREYVERRHRCLDTRQKMQAGELRTVDDLITCNLDIRQFMQDVVEQHAGPELLRAIWQAMVGRVPEKSTEHFRHGLTVLDPTCGSGAFLFAALSVLEPLYEACIERMEDLVEEADCAGKRDALPDFRQVLAEVNRHPSRRYYIYKSIVVHNLFGVDIMAEAVEICKLRLFLKLVSQVESVRQLEPLPDIDFNIRPGNTLVGYATLEQLRASANLASDRKQLLEIEARAADLADAFDRFREQQTKHGGKVTPNDKRGLRERLSKLSQELDRFLAVEYGKDPDKAREFADWRASHQPFHWLAEFYGVMRDGGFDVVIGNPPYVATRKVTDYSVSGYQTSRCSDIYAWCLERVADIAAPKARTGMIVPLSLSFSGDFDDLRQLLYTRYEHNWFSHFARIPAALFAADVRVRNTIHLGKVGAATGKQLTSRLHRWFEIARPHLFEALSYAEYEPRLWKGRIPKLNTRRLITAFERLAKTGRTLAAHTSRRATRYQLNFKKSAYNWLSFTHEEAPCYAASGKRIPQTKYGAINFQTADDRDVAFLTLNGKLQFAFWVAIGDDFDVTTWMFADLPISLSQLDDRTRTRLLPVVNELKGAVEDAVQYKLNAGKRVGNYNLAKCRSVTDKSDAILATALGIEDAWDDVELLYVQIVKTDFETDADDEE